MRYIRHRINRTLSDAPNFRISGSRAQAAFDLGAMHDAPYGVVEGIAPMHGATIVPHHESADLPDMLPLELRTIDEAPELIEQGLGLRQFEPHQIGVAAAAEIKHLAPRVGMDADQRMHGAGRGPG